MGAAAAADAAAAAGGGGATAAPVAGCVDIFTLWLGELPKDPIIVEFFSWILKPLRPQ